MDNLNTVTAGMKYVTGLAGTGPVGLVAIVVGVLGALACLIMMVKRANHARDDSDLDQGGADAGITAQTLRNQADLNRAFEQAQREQFDRDV